MAPVARNAQCPCGSGRKYKLCCLPRQPSRRASPPILKALETIDATGRGCLWTIYEHDREPEVGGGQLVEHACNGERFEVDAAAGWLCNGKRMSMLAVLDALPPQLAPWALRRAFASVSDQELTLLGVELARVILLAGAVVDVAGEVTKTSRGRLRRARAAWQRQAAA